jgi:transposase
MGSTRRSFTPEYKAAAVDLVLGGGRTIADVARSIGVHEMTLGKWVKKTRDDGQPPGGGPLNEDERAELERLRAELPRVRMELEFAKKVATWFAKDPR